MLKKISLLRSTVKHLKLTQIKYQVLYRLKKAGLLSSYNADYNQDKLCFLSFIKTPPVYKSLLGRNSFTFLNLQVDFKTEIDWNFQEHGKLWNYNLQYMNYLLQEDIAKDEKIHLIDSLDAWLLNGKLSIEPYPVSLRSINIIRFCSLHQIKEPKILRNLHAELDFLSKRPEYHLLGNHLLENAFALIMGGVFFSETTWLQQGKEILIEELDEQILSDGAHFELSPMYHQIIFFRLLELVDWYSKWSHKEDDFEKFLFSKAEVMCSWLENMTFKNGEIPHFNDSSNGIAYSTKWLTEYASELGVKRQEGLNLGESGYRVYKKEIYECIIDVAEIGPSYQPGHGHADALSFVLNVVNKPIFVERGTSTYEANNTRQLERSTTSHNTVVVRGRNQSEVYGGFRVGNRAKTKIQTENKNQLTAEHNGYLKSLNIVHTRSFSFNEDCIEIIDSINENINAVAYFHFHPDINLNIDANSCFIDEIGSISFEKANRIEILSYDYANGYNNTIKASALCVEFNIELKTRIHLTRTN